MSHPIKDVLLHMAAGFTDGESSRFALTDRIREFDMADPDHLIQPIRNSDAAAMLAVGPNNLSGMRHQGKAPPGYAPTALGLYYLSRHEIILWAMGRENVAPELQSLAAAYPWKGMSHQEMVDRATDIHPQHFEALLNAVEAGRFVGRTRSDFLQIDPCAFLSAEKQKTPFRGCTAAL